MKYEEWIPRLHRKHQLEMELSKSILQNLYLKYQPQPQLRKLSYFLTQGWQIWQNTAHDDNLDKDFEKSEIGQPTLTQCFFSYLFI